MAFKGTRCISSSVESRGNGTYLICFAREWLSNPLPKVVLGVDVYQWKRKTPSMRKITLPVLWQLRAGAVEKRSVSFTCGDRFEDAGKQVVELAEGMTWSKREECGRNYRPWSSASEGIQQASSGCQQRGVDLVLGVPA